MRYIGLTVCCVVLLSACDNYKQKTDTSTISPYEAAAKAASVFIPSQDNSSTSNIPPKELKALKGSVVDSGKDVIVNAANPSLAPGGFLSGAIFEAAGRNKPKSGEKEGTYYLTQEIEHAKKQNRLKTPLETAQVFTTESHALTSKGTLYIIHALGPDFRGKPYQSNFQKGYTDLRKTYQNIYAEMNKLYATDNRVTSVGIAPISAGIYAGGADKSAMYIAMIEETFNAMQKYSFLQPEFYLYGNDEFDAVQKLLKPTIDKMIASISPTAISAGSITMQMALMSNSIYQHACGQQITQGARHNVGPTFLTGVTTQNQRKSKAEFTIGTTAGPAVIGVGLETGLDQGDLTYYVIKASSLCEISSVFLIGTSVGYVHENINAQIANNVRQFLNRMNFIDYDYRQQGVTWELAAQYKSKIGAHMDFSLDFGLRSIYLNHLKNLPFVQMSLKANNLDASVVIMQDECAFNVALNY